MNARGTCHGDVDDYEPEGYEGHERVELVRAIHCDAQQHNQRVVAKQNLKNVAKIINSAFIIQ